MRKEIISPNEATFEEAVYAHTRRKNEEPRVAQIVKWMLEGINVQIGRGTSRQRFFYLGNTGFIALNQIVTMMNDQGWHVYVRRFTCENQPCADIHWSNRQFSWWHKFKIWI
jgi:hypothetical protein